MQNRSSSVPFAQMKAILFCTVGSTSSYPCELRKRLLLCREYRRATVCTKTISTDLYIQIQTHITEQTGCTKNFPVIHSLLKNSAAHTLERLSSSLSAQTNDGTQGG